jgi:acetylornithine deacetylase/succinyl-diaminopimelate desuccinylase-like protein
MNNTTGLAMFSTIVRFLTFSLSLVLSLGSYADDQSAHSQLARGLLERMVSYETVYGKGQVPAMSEELKGFFLSNGFAAKDILYFPLESAGTGSLVVRYAGSNRAAQPILLMAHMDVVPANRANWSYEPYALTEHDGYFYGRGTLDNKGGVAVIAATLAKLKQDGFTPVPDLYFVLTGDEETMAQTTRNLFKDLPVLKRAKYALNSDGGMCVLDTTGKAEYCQVNTAEKTYMTFFASLKNPGGHSSLPRKDHAIYEMAQALVKLASYQFPIRTNDTTLAYFSETASMSSAPLGEYKKRFALNQQNKQAESYLSSQPLENSIMRTTCTTTMLDAGHAENALPMNVKATINCRVFPGVSLEEVQTQLETVLDNTGITVKASFRPGNNPASAINSEVFQAIQGSVHRNYPGIPVIPFMTASSTDSAITRSAGVPTYGVSSFSRIKSEPMRAHGKDERLAVDTFYDGLGYWESVLRTLAVQ